MGQRQLIVLPKPTKTKNASQQGWPAKTRVPSHKEQSNRIDPKFEAVAKALSSEKNVLHADRNQVSVENVLVFEAVNSDIDLFKVCKSVVGIDWLAEFTEEVDPDDDFHELDEKGNRSDRQVANIVYCTMTNQRGMGQLLKLWKKYEADSKAVFPKGSAPLKQLFKHLRDVRYWSLQDRISETCFLENLQFEAELGKPVRFEIDLWFHNSNIKRLRFLKNVEAALKASGGQVINSADHEPIRYLAILAELPPKIVLQWVEGIRNSEQLAKGHPLLLSEVQTFRPAAQCIVEPIVDREDVGKVEPRGRELPSEKPPIVALLDGLPLENHELLSGRLLINDVDDLETKYSASQRQHGSAMASLICHGDLSANEAPLSRRIYVRPILEPDETGEERIPVDQLSVDLTFRAVQEMLKTRTEETKEIRIINFSIGDASRIFLRHLSPWARMIDWLSYNYRVLFLVSSGNHPDEIEIDCGWSTFLEMNVKEREGHVHPALRANSRNQRLLSPSEAMNCITVGAIHDDASEFEEGSSRFNPIPRGRPATYSALGKGYRNSIKPDVLFPGGQLLYRTTGLNGDKFLAKPISDLRSPGLKVAFPGREGELNGVAFLSGTSNATALATRTAAMIFERLDSIDDSENPLNNSTKAVLTKTLLVHGANWEGLYDVMKDILAPDDSDGDHRREASTYLGYGRVDSSRCLYATDTRATMITWGTIVAGVDGKTESLLIPLPVCLSGQTVRRRLAVTLAWLTPLNNANRKYRSVRMSFNCPAKKLEVSRTDADAREVHNGTVQHEIFWGEKAAIITEGDSLQVDISARSFAVEKSYDLVPFGIAVSLEVAEETGLPISDQIEEQVRLRASKQQIKPSL